MVKIDELNKYIEDFGEVVQDVKKIADTATDVKAITTMQTELNLSFEKEITNSKKVFKTTEKQIVQTLENGLKETSEKLIEVDKAFKEQQEHNKSLRMLVEQNGKSTDLIKKKQDDIDKVLHEQFEYTKENLDLIKKKQEENKAAIEGYIAKTILEQNSTLTEIISSKEKNIIELVEKNQKLTLFAIIAGALAALLSAVVLLQIM